MVKNNKHKNRYTKKSGKKPSMPKKELVKAIKAITLQTMETKTINVPDFLMGTNCINRAYNSLNGNVCLCNDLFKLPQGVKDSTVIGGVNRIGDKIRGIGFLMDYYFTNKPFYSLGLATFFIPFVKLRITVYTAPFQSIPLPQGLLYDMNFLNTATSTLQPINWDEGYVKEILYDQVHIVKNELSSQYGGSGAITPSQLGNVFHFKKYIKYDRVIKYADNNTTTPDATDRPVIINMIAEVDDAFTGLVPSSQPIFTVTGYTRCWFKDV